MRIDSSIIEGESHAGWRLFRFPLLKSIKPPYRMTPNVPNYGHRGKIHLSKAVKNIMLII